MKGIMDINEIIQYLPHRYPFLLIDRVLEIELGKSLVAIKNVTINEPFFTGHFPGMPVMPGVLILEALAQATCVLAYKSTDSKPSDEYLYLFAGIDNARFKRVVVPGDQLRLDVELQKCKQGIWKFSGKASVDGELVCSADMISAKKVTKRD
jgi:3-hydroxyacyl-[acyl-carrier-protein] dehydratase